MKKIRNFVLLGIAAITAISLIGCSEPDGSNKPTTVSPASLSNTNATTDVTEDNFEEAYGRLMYDLFSGTFEEILDAVEESDGGKKIDSEISRIFGSVGDGSSGSKETFSGDIEGLPAGISVCINNFSVNSVTSETSESVKGNINAGINVNFDKFFDGIKEENQTCLQECVLNVAFDESAVISDDLEKDVTSIAGKISFKAGLGLSFCTEEGLGGKLIANASVSFTGKIEDERAWIRNLATKVREGNLTVEDLEYLTVNLDVKFYNDKGDVTYVAADIKTRQQLVDFVNTRTNNIK